MIRFVAFLFLLMGLYTSAVAQTKKPKVDSLLQELKKRTQIDTMRVKVLCALCWEFRGVDHEKATEYGKEALMIAEKIDYPAGINQSMSFLGVVKRNSGDFPRAMNYFFDALRIAEKYKLKREKGYAYNNIGDIFRYQGDDRQALEYTKKALEIFISINDIRGMGYAHVRIGEIYQALEDYPEALAHFEQSLQIRLPTGDKDAIQTTLGRIGIIYRLTKNYDKALEYTKKSTALSAETKDVQGYASNLSELAQIYLDKGDYAEALKNGQVSNAMLERIKAARNMMNGYRLMADIYQKINKFDSAYYYQTKFIQVKDILVNEKNVNLIGKAQNDYRLEKKQEEIDLINKERRLESLLRYATTGVLVLMIAVAFLLLRNNQNRKRANILLLKQNEEIRLQREETSSIAEKLRSAHHELSEQKALVDAKSEDIQASIMYAKRIQNAMLPPMQRFKDLLPDSFVLFKPRDIVSGDFYWLTEVGDKTIVVIADCTGHGVPGGFMSMIGINLINEMIKVLGVTKPEIILSGLNMGVRNILNQATSHNQDGMDVSICVIDRAKKVLEFAAAKHSLLYAYLDKEDENVEELHQIKGDREPIGGMQGGETRRVFHAHTLDLSRPLILYMASDGFQDQFGGKDARKFMKKQFRELLFSIHRLPVHEQLNQMEGTLNEWMGLKHKQIDDILVVGLRIEL